MQWFNAGRSPKARSVGYSTISMALGLGCAIALAASGPLLARFYGEPRLVTIAAVSAITFVTSALTCQHYALLRRAMMFQELAILDVGANLLGCECCDRNGVLRAGILGAGAETRHHVLAAGGWCLAEMPLDAAETRDDAGTSRRCFASGSTAPDSRSPTSSAERAIESQSDTEVAPPRSATIRTRCSFTTICSTFSSPHCTVSP